jgi:hypothetical protein
MVKEFNKKVASFMPGNTLGLRHSRNNRPQGNAPALGCYPTHKELEKNSQCFLFNFFKAKD